MFEIGVTFQPSLNIFSDNDRKLWTAQDNRGESRKDNFGNILSER